MRQLSIRIALCALPLLSVACGATFTPPIRGDLDFAATRVAPGSPELQVGVMSPDRVSGQLGYRHSVTPRDTLEAFVFDHKAPGERAAFTMGGVGYRRHLSEVDAPVQATLGFGAGGGIGGDYEHVWNDDNKHYAGAIGGYLDFGVAWRVSPVVSLYAAGRAQRSVGVHFSGTYDANNPNTILPPPTEWAQGGGGVRVDLHPVFVTLDAGWAGYSNRIREDDSFMLGLGLGWRVGNAPGATKL